MESAARSVLVSVMHTDLAGSTATGRELDAQSDESKGAQAFFARHQQLVSDVLRDSNAIVERWEGDGSMSAFTSVAEALRAAAAIQHLAATYNENPLRLSEFRVRIGLAAGEGFVRDNDVGGEPTIVSRRICDNVAEPGQVVCTDMVSSLVAGSTKYVFHELGQQTLAGYDHPHRLVDFDWRATQARLAPTFPDGLLDGSEFGFAGREEELDVLRSAWADADAGSTRMIALAGSAGAGKTRLAAQAALDSHALGSEVLLGRCSRTLHDAEQEPYQPFAEMVRRHFTTHGELTENPSTDAVLAQLLTNEQRAEAGWEPAAMQGPSLAATGRMRDAVVAWLERISAHRTVVLVIDDIIWADRDSANLVTHILQYAGDLRLMIIATYRDTAAEIPEGFTQSQAIWDRCSNFARLNVGGLAPSAAATMVERAEHLDVDRADLDFATTLVELTDGLPFFMGDLVTTLHSRGELSAAMAGDWPEASDGPDNGARVALQRLEHIDPGRRDIVLAASVIGPLFDVDILIEATGETRVRVLEALDEAERADIVRVDSEQSGRGRYGFAHELLREALRRSLSRSRRFLLHEAIADALETHREHDRADHAAEIAFHLERSADLDRQRRAIELYGAAADRALERAAPGTAATLLGRAADLATRLAQPEDEQLELQFRLGLAQKRAGNPDSQATLRDVGTRARAAGRSDIVIHAAIGNARGLYNVVGRVDEERVAQIEDALAVLEAGQHAEHAALLAGLSEELTFAADRERAEVESRRALALARQSGDAKAVVRALNGRHSVLWNPAGLRERVEIIDEWFELAVSLEDPGWAASAASFGYQAAVESGDADLAERRLADLLRYDTELRQPALSAYVLLWRGVDATLRGDLAAAEDFANRAAKQNQVIGNSDGDAWWLGQMFPVRWHQGRLAELRDLFAFGWETNPQLPVLGAALVDIDADLGEFASAQKVLDGLPMEDIAEGRGQIDHLVIVACLVRAAASLDDRELAARMQSLLEPFADQHISNGSVHFGSVQHYVAITLALQGDRVGADEAFAVAEASNRDLRSAPLTAHTQLAWGTHLLDGDGDDRDRGRGLLGQALVTADQLGLGGIAAQARRALARTGR